MWWIGWCATAGDDRAEKKQKKKKPRSRRPAASAAWCGAPPHRAISTRCCSAASPVPLLTRDSYYSTCEHDRCMNLLADDEPRSSSEHRTDQHGPHLFMGIGGLCVGAPGTRVGLRSGRALLGALVPAARPCIGRVALRVSGPYYFLITFAFSEVVRLFFNNFFEALGGPSGLVRFPSPAALLGGLRQQARLRADAVLCLARDRGAGPPGLRAVRLRPRIRQGDLWPRRWA